jgi:peptidoglycan/xylan/chitin deacetylase (PgdA/CDA1 family)
LRDYGNRVGIFRIFKALDRFNIKPTVAINGALVERAPYLMDMIAERKDEVIAHGWQMDMLHSGELAKDEENNRIQRTIDSLNNRFESSVKGWLSPGRFQTANTPELLAKNHIEYMCDWVNDDMPYQFKTDSGDLHSLPLSNELDDFFILSSNLHSEDSYAEQVCDAADFLCHEAETEGGRILALNIHPWLLGQPHRIALFERVLEHISAKAVWSAGANDILNCWQSQQ